MTISNSTIEHHKSPKSTYSPLFFCLVKLFSYDLVLKLIQYWSTLVYMDIVLAYDQCLTLCLFLVIMTKLWFFKWDQFCGEWAIQDCHASELGWSIFVHSCQQGAKKVIFAVHWIQSHLTKCLSCSCCTNGRDEGTWSDSVNVVCICFQSVIILEAGRLCWASFIIYHVISS